MFSCVLEGAPPGRTDSAHSEPFSWDGTIGWIICVEFIARPEMRGEREREDKRRKGERERT
jgi:hypothetical protein